MKDTLRQPRDHAREIFMAGVRAVDPAAAVGRHMTVAHGQLAAGGNRFNLDDIDRVLVVGAGKAAAPMARAVEDLLGNRIREGVIVVKEGHGLPLSRITVCEAGHPVPDRRGVHGTERILALVENAGEKDLVICLISGGGSALLAAPAPGVSLEDKQLTTRLLLACGATIHEFNTVRKHLSRVKGGRLARMTHPAVLVGLILSDVVGDDLDVIASGPTVPDRTTFGDARQVLEGYGIWDRTPASVRRHIEQGLAGRVADTPKPQDPAFRRGSQVLVGTNLQALTAAGKAAETLGYAPLILSSKVTGEAREAALFYTAVAKEICASRHPAAPPVCVLAGGETTVTLAGDGRGGRNQEFALAAGIALDGWENIVVLSGGTDGTDGPTDAAGAVADGRTAGRAREKGLDPRAYLQRNDSHAFFERLGDLVVTGPTRTNVMDIYLCLVGLP